MITSWDDERRLTDADHSITAADTAGENLTVTVWPELDEFDWQWFRWVLDEHIPTDDGRGGCEWIDNQLATGVRGCEETARADGEKAKESYLLTLIRK